MSRPRGLGRIVTQVIRTLLILGRPVRGGRPHGSPPAPAVPPVPVGATTRAPVVAAHGEIEVPDRSVWPVVLALGIMTLLFGVVTSWGFSAVGLLVVIWSLGGWIGELRHGG